MLDATTSQSVFDTILRHKSFALTTHHGADADGVGSMYALAWLLEALGKNVHVSTKTGLPNKPEVIMYLDTADPKLTPLAAHSFRRDIQSVLIDHHPPVRNHVRLQLIDIKAVSTTAMIFEFLTKRFHVKPPVDVAAKLWEGLMVDTHNLQHQIVSGHTFALAATLLNLRLRRPGSSAHYNEIPMAELRTLGHLMQRATICNNISCAIIPPHVSLSSEVKTELASLITSIKESELGMMVSQHSPSHVKVSWRSEPFKAMRARHLAEFFGGGGHDHAAGCVIPGKLSLTDNRWQIVPAAV